jgi:hypothetical protein
MPRSIVVRPVFSFTSWCSRRCAAGWKSCCRVGGAGGDSRNACCPSRRPPVRSYMRSQRVGVGSRAPCSSSTSHASRRCGSRVRAVRSSERVPAVSGTAAPTSASRARWAPRADRGVWGIHTSCCSAGVGCGGDSVTRRESSHALSSVRICRVRRAAPSRSPAGLRCSGGAAAATSRWTIAAAHWLRPSASDANPPGMSSGRLVSNAASAAGGAAARCASGLRRKWLEPAKVCSRGATVGRNRSAGSIMPPFHRGCRANERIGDGCSARGLPPSSRNRRPPRCHHCPRAHAAAPCRCCRWWCTWGWP